MLFAAEPDLATAARIETVLPFTIAAHRQTRAEGIGGADEQAVRCRGKRASAPVELVAEAVTRDRLPVDAVVVAPQRKATGFVESIRRPATHQSGDIQRPCIGRPIRPQSRTSVR